jgi:hypothetical protein
MDRPADLDVEGVVIAQVRLQDDDQPDRGISVVDEQPLAGPVP